MGEGNFTVGTTKCDKEELEIHPRIVIHPRFVFMCLVFNN